MKKIISLLLALVMCLSLCACGGGNNSTTEEPTQTPTEEELRLATENDAEEDIVLTNAAYAVAYLGSFLKNPHSMEVYSIKTKTVAGSYFYVINYSAENNVGGRIEDTCCIRYSQNKVGVLSTNGAGLSFEDASEEAKELYDKFVGAEETKLDVDTVMALYALISD